MGNTSRLKKTCKWEVCDTDLCCLSILLIPRRAPALMISIMVLLDVQLYPHWSCVCLEFTCNLSTLNLSHVLLLCTLYTDHWHFDQLQLQRHVEWWICESSELNPWFFPLLERPFLASQTTMTSFSRAVHELMCYKRKQWSGSCLAPGMRQFCHDLLCYLPKPSFYAMVSFLLITRSYCLKLPLWRETLLPQ